MTGFELAQLAVLGFATGMGTTLGAELARELFSKTKHTIEKHRHEAA